MNRVRVYAFDKEEFCIDPDVEFDIGAWYRYDHFAMKRFRVAAARPREGGKAREQTLYKQCSIKHITFQSSLWEIQFDLVQYLWTKHAVLVS